MDCNFCVAKTKVLISLTVTICVFVFAYAKSWFSHKEALLSYIHIYLLGTVDSSVQAQPTVEEAFTMIQDQIAHSLFNITLQTREYQVHVRS